MSAPRILFICSFIGVLTVQTSQAESTYEAKSRLEKMLLDGYKKEARSVLEYQDNVTITVGISLYLIKSLDDKNQILTTSLWIRQKWNDPRLTWKPKDFSSVKDIRISSGKIWLPDLKVYNQIEQQMDSGLDQSRTRVIVNHLGDVLWMSPSVLRSSCQVDIGFFPYDTQTCNLKIGSWTYDGFAVDVKPESYTMDVSKSPSNPEWELVSTQVKRNVQIYPCCPEPYPDVTYRITIKRRVQNYWINFILPGMFLTIMTMVTFISPASDFGERVSLVLTLLVSMFFFLKMVAEKTPTSDTIPLLSSYFVMLSFEIGLIFLSVCISVNSYHMNPANGDMSGRVRTYVLEKLGRLWGFTKDGRDISRKLQALQDPSSMRDIVREKLEKRQPGFRYRHMSSSSSNSSLLRDGGNNAKNSTKNQAVCTKFSASVDKRRFPDDKCSTSSVHISTNYRGEDLVSETSTWSKISQSRHPNLSSQHFPAGATMDIQGPLCSCPMLLHEMAVSNERLLSSVQEILYVARQFDKKSSEKERWLLAAVILDQAFLFIFVIAFISVTLSNFIIK